MEMGIIRTNTCGGETPTWNWAEGEGGLQCVSSRASLGGSEAGVELERCCPRAPGAWLASPYNLSHWIQAAQRRQSLMGRWLGGFLLAAFPAARAVRHPSLKEHVAVLSRHPPDSHRSVPLLHGVSVLGG